MSPEAEDYTIQRMGEEDLEEVARLEKLCFSDPWTKGSFRHELSNRFSIPLVVKSGAKVVGYTCLWHIYEQMEIANIAVSPDLRQKGIGSMMIRRVLAEAGARGCRSVILSVRQSNRPAIRLYRKFGFVELDRRKGYYRLPPEDAVVMIKSM